MKKLLYITLVMGLVAMAFALKTYEKVFETKYNVTASSNLGKAKCLVCHNTAKGAGINPYGKDLAAAMKAAKTKKLTPELLVKIEGLDSDKDGVKNIDEIKKDQMPGSK